MRRTLVSVGCTIAACLAFLGAAPTSAPPSDAGVVSLARAREIADDAAGAIADLKTYVDGHPDDLTAGRLLGDLYFRAQDFRSAELVWKSLYRWDSQDSATHARLGGLYEAEGRYTDAVAEYEKTLPLRSGLIALVRLHTRMRDLGTFLGELQGDLERKKFDPDALSLYANALEATDRKKEALPYFDRVIAIRPADCDAIIDRATDLVAIGRMAEGVLGYEKCLSIDPHSYAALTDLGAAYLNSNDLTRAKDYFDRALAVNPSGAEALVNRGCIEDIANNWHGALDFYQAAIAADPMRPEAYINVGFDFLDRRSFGGAELYFESGLRAAPLDGRLHLLLARTFREEGRIEAALQQYRDAIRSDEPAIVHEAKSAMAQLAVNP